GLAKPAPALSRRRPETPRFCPDTKPSRRSATCTISRLRRCRWTARQRDRTSSQSHLRIDLLSDRRAEAADLVLAGLEIVGQLVERAGRRALVVVHDRPRAVIAARDQPVRIGIIIEARRLEMHLPRGVHD